MKGQRRLILNLGDDDGDDGDDDDTLPECWKYDLPEKDGAVDVNAMVLGFGITLVVFAVYNLVLHFSVRMPVEYQAFLDKEYEPLQALLATCGDPWAIYYTGYLVFAVVSLQKKYHHLASYLLLDMIRLSPVTKDTLNALWVPRRQIFMTVLLTFIIAYVYRVFAFFFLQ